MSLLLFFTCIAAIYVAFSLCGLAITFRCGRPRLVIMIGGLAVAPPAYIAIDTYIYCSAEPKYFPTDGEVGKVEFACDGPMGYVAYLATAACAAAGSILILSTITFYVIARVRSAKLKR